MTPIPNFFIIGAPKCGTTSLAAWLAEHPQVFFSSEKEPHHFNRDRASVLTPERSDYEAYFRAAQPHHRAIGEGSVWYLYSEVAVPLIEDYSPGARYIVCLRNPVEMAVSLHEQQIVSGHEHVADFAQAWALSDARLRGEAVSRWCREPAHLAYGTACKLGEQLRRLYRVVPRERVMTVLLDDLRQDPRRVYRQVLAFLGVDDDGRTVFRAENTAKQLKSTTLRKCVRALGGLKRRLGIRRGLGILKAMDRHNLNYRPRAALDPALRQRLERHFAADIALLADLIDRDLSHWLQAP